ncbi:MAG: entericidin A/B family lipoprotein [Phycisphaeraceae bacterium]
MNRACRWGGRLAVWTAALALAFILTGCNTLEGVGEDLEAAGEAIGDAAR